MISAHLGFDSKTSFQLVPSDGKITAEEGEEFSAIVVTPFTLEQYEVKWNISGDSQEKMQTQDSYFQLNSTFSGTKSKTDIYLMAQVLQAGVVIKTFNFEIKGM